MNVHAQTQNCPRVMQTGDRIFTDPAGQYRWLDADGNPIPNAHQADFIPSGEGRFAVEVSGISMSYRFDPNGNKPKILKGKALDFFLKPIADAQITLQGKTVQTDARGEFILPFNATQGRREAVRCNKNGFYTSIRGFHPTDAETLYTQFILSERKVNFTYDAKDGGIFSQPGVWIKLPANGYMDESGKRYTGKVNLSYRSARPGDAHFGALMPGGDFLALNANGQTRALESYGFTEVLLADDSGNALQLAPGVTAQLRFLIPEGLRGKAPETMPLWYMNENEGIWREEGAVQKDGLFYTGTVSHFTPWNCDDPFPPSVIKGRVVDCEGQPVPGATVYVDHDQVCTTDDKGYYQATVGAGLPFIVNSLSYEITGTALGANQVKMLPNLIDIMKGAIFIGVIKSYDVGNDVILNISTSQPNTKYQYSIDGGANYSYRTEYDLSQMSPELHPKQVWIKNDTCADFQVKIDIFRILYKGNFDCHFFDYDVTQFSNARPTDVSSKPYAKLDGYYYTLESLINSNELYKVLEQKTCLQHLIIINSARIDPLQFQLLPNQLNNLTELVVWRDGGNVLYLDSKPQFQLMRWLTLPNLKKIAFSSRCRIGTNNFEEFSSLHNIEFVEWEEPDTTTINSIFKLPNLKALKLRQPSGNRGYLNRLFNSKSIQKLSISGPFFALGTFPINDNIDNNVLEELHLSSMELDISFNISKFRNLQKLTINACTGIWPLFLINITSINTLEVLNLGHNSITSIPPTISALSGTLKELILTGNPIPETERATIQSWLPNTLITW